MNRPTWDEYFLALAITASTRAACNRSQVGAILVTSENRALSIGYNGVPSGELHCSDGGCPRGRHYDIGCPIWGKGCLDDHQRCACGGDWPCPDAVAPLSPYNEGPGRCNGNHAEYNALDALPMAMHPYVSGSTMYITREPCHDCTEMLKDWDVVKAVWPDGELLL